MLIGFNAWVAGPWPSRKRSLGLPPREWPVGLDYLAFSDEHRALRASGMRHIDLGFSGSSADSMLTTTERFGDKF